MSAQATVPVHEVILDASQVAAVPAEPVPGGHEDIHHSILWRHGNAYAGLMTLAPGAHLPAHRHHDMAHHVWVVAGQVGVLHRTLGAGSYWYIPAGSEHTLAAGDAGCTLFYLYTSPE